MDLNERRKMPINRRNVPACAHRVPRFVDGKIH